MTLSRMLAGAPPPRTGLPRRDEIRRELEKTRSRLVVVDDDPTGTQTVHGIRVYMDWSVPTLSAALARDDAVFYVSTNSRALPPEEMTRLSLELGRNLRAAAEGTDTRILIASRSDSTLRGHYPGEVDALLSGLGREADGVILAPALFEAGRYTIGDVHWVEQSGGLVRAGETEFARDPAFGYRNSDLKEWVEEKTSGRWKAREVLSLSLETLRAGGPEAARDILMRARGGVPVVLNAACYEDIETAVAALMEAEKAGKRFAYRCAACFVKVRGGFQDRPLLGPGELGLRGGPGLVVVGSYVDRTNRQLEALLGDGLCQGVELRVGEIAEGPGPAAAETARAASLADRALQSGRSAAIYTSREVRRAEGKDFLGFGSRVMAALCDVVREVRIRPDFLVAKGGITSVEIARAGLGVKEAFVPGQIAPGVPVWELGPETRWPGIHYVVFPGNVGDDFTLGHVVRALSARPEGGMAQ